MGYPASGTGHGDGGTHTVAQPHTVRKAGVDVGTRKALNLIEGTNVTLTVADDATNDEVDVTIAASGGGGGGGLVHIETKLLTVDTANVTFTAIPGTYKDLMVLGRTRTNRAAPNDVDGIYIRFGAGGTIDAGTNYRYISDRFGVTSGNDRAFNAAQLFANAIVPAEGAHAGAFGYFQMHVFDYADTAYWRHCDWKGGGNFADQRYHNVIGAGAWQNAVDAITDLRLLPTTGTAFKAGTNFRLYGMQ